MAKVDIVCATCGSNNIRMDAWAEWDIDTQEWILSDIFPNYFCINCDVETSTKEVII